MIALAAADAREERADDRGEDRDAAERERVEPERRARGSEVPSSITATR
jgi:hypothetical protein